MYDDGRITEQRIEDLKTILKFEKPPNTVIQFRFQNAVDDGRVLKDHLRTRNSERSDPIACVLQATNLSLYEEAIRSGQVMRQTATVWIRVPVRDKADNSLLSGAFPSIIRSVRANGLLRFLRDPIVKARNSCDEGLISRELKTEKECRVKASRVFQSFEVNFPKQLTLREMQADELFASIFTSHRRESSSVPILPDRGRVDIRRYIASTRIESGSELFVRHNGTPTSLVSLKSLPNGFVTADVMRYLTATRNICFPHEIVVDLMTTEKHAAKKDLQKRIDRIEGSRNTWLGFRNLKKDAVVIKGDLENLLEQVEADNEEICRLRMNVIVFADRSKGAKEAHRQ
ncbi:hypothetical protein [Leptolyngbya sp. 7M]|uniref:hypothetical protein n=1 Tax=Leptolyngbya sp. 7M TaxID=2812896 RepID=UPI001B8B8985|nr:hypothetical protein [Leptolyngbya sp. 7M]QYO64892.1 hypothetical protein JVX88_35995 [Leptolyngbya sp. 7M]